MLFTIVEIIIALSFKIFLDFSALPGTEETEKNARILLIQTASWRLAFLQYFDKIGLSFLHAKSR